MKPPEEILRSLPEPSISVERNYGDDLETYRVEVHGDFTEHQAEALAALIRMAWNLLAAETAGEG